MPLDCTAHVHVHVHVHVIARSGRAVKASTKQIIATGFMGVGSTASGNKCQKASTFGLEKDK
jgi:hypothetical protein